MISGHELITYNPSSDDLSQLFEELPSESEITSDGLETPVLNLEKPFGNTMEEVD